MLSEEIDTVLVADVAEDMREIGTPHQTLRAEGVVDTFVDVVGVSQGVVFVRLAGLRGELDVDVRILGEV